MRSLAQAGSLGRLLCPLFLASSSLLASACGAAPATDEGAAQESGLVSPAPVTPFAERPARPPVMGWGTWNRFHCGLDEKTLLETADALVSSGMRDAGYDTFVIDDCWQGGRDASGTLIADPVKLPHGMKALGDALHARGLRFGIYSAVGMVTCELRPGSWGHEDHDAATFASWGVDFLKQDWCWHAGVLERVGALSARDAYAKMRGALDRAGREIVFSVASMGTREAIMVMPEKFVGEWAPGIADMWRVGGDITNDWAGVTHGLLKSNDWAASAAPGRYNDPDNLQVGNGAPCDSHEHVPCESHGLSPTEGRAHFSMWAVAGAPLIAGNDLRAMDDDTRKILLHREVIAIDQDPRMIQGTKVKETLEGLQIWSKPLAGSGRRAVAFFNPTEREAGASIRWSDVGLRDAPARVRDLWEEASPARDLAGFTALVPAHGVTLLVVDGAEPTPPRGDAWLSDQVFTYAANHWGLVERDRSVGDRDPDDGNALWVGSKRYDKGLGVHAPSDVRVHLGGACRSFEAEIGVDDETLWDSLTFFEVWGDGVQLYRSPPRAKGRALPISVDVSGRQELRLVVRGAGSTDFDHADWAAARLHCDP